MEEATKKMLKIMRELHELPYFKNYAAASGAVHNISKHEDIICSVFENNDLILWNPDNKERPKTNTILKWINNSIDNINDDIPLPDNSYMSQPCGTHNSPDFIIKLTKNIIFGIESKSTDKVCCPMYNSGGIKQNLIYVFCSNATNSTTIYLGKDIISVEQQKMIDHVIAKQRQLEKEVNIDLKALDINNRGISYYTRPMIQQSGGNKYTNYFTHERRKECEDNVYKFISDTIEKKYR